ncbi:hypothetical protein J5X91_12635 [Pseudoalteromonas sp. K222D]|uniref:hypothetical protein n=1 Tax=Pseudoalteromonas sp. K222D TaxID=2820756 RepID=UPI001AD6C2CD|nr:hypothetical protein [Pseudoalteromonas sp. K222D]MBO7927098.1 hypothetical protein [Pseudoalteromonas sp. K222D]
MNKIASIFIAVTLLLTTGCTAIMTAEQAAPTLNKPQVDEIQITVVDHRPYVVNGDKLSGFEGLSRSGFGIPYTQNIITGETMPQHLGKRLAAGFIRSGINAKLIATTPQVDINDIKADSDTATIIIVLNEWKYDHHAFTDNSWYNFDLIIKDRTGATLINKNFTGEQDIPSMHTNDLQMLYKERFELAFADPEVKALL